MAHKNKSKLLAYLGVSFWFLAIIFLILPSWPHIYYRLSPETSDVLATTIGETKLAPNNFQTLNSQEPKTPTAPTPTPIHLPPLDSTLPKENGLIIESIGIQGEIHEGKNWEEILKNGIWHAPDSSTPEKVGATILAAHRWGYLSWSNQFRRLNSFYNLPDLKDGDIIKVIWNQRKYEYQIYKTEEGETISDYTADLILYTCKLWESPIRIIKYAKRIN
jgi:sortase (surface protein transpeptidase)